MRHGRPLFAEICPDAGRCECDGAFEERLAVIQEDIRNAGGLESWIHTRLEVWLKQAERERLERRCPTLVPKHRSA